jgi:hypothetical protein
LEAVVARHRAREQHAIGGGDGAAVAREALDDRAVVAGLGVEVVGAEHLDVVELHEQHGERRHQEAAEAADRAVHQRTPTSAAPAWARSGAARAGSTVGYPQHQGHQHVVGHQRRTAVRDERQHHAGEGQHPDDPGDDHERLHAHQCGEPGGEQLVELVVGVLGDAQARTRRSAGR